MSLAPELETQRLRLRHFRADDLDAYARITADAETMRFIGHGTPFDREEAWLSLSNLRGHWELRGFGLWAVEEKQTAELVGRIGLYQPEGWPGLEVGWLVARSRWNRGYATEGARASMRFAFESLAAPRVISMIRPENAASIRVAEKLGEQLDHDLEFRGKPALVYARDASDWQREAS